MWRAAERLFAPVLTVVFPSSCAACGQLLKRPCGGPLCESCWAALPRHQAAVCLCGLPLLPTQVVCGRCRDEDRSFVAGTYLGPYEGSLRLALRALKYAGRRGVAARLADLLFENEGVRVLLDTSDLLVPVPLHPRRLRTRGFNQSALVARRLARRSGRPVSTGVLGRGRDTPPQTGLSADERRRNVRGAFTVKRPGVICGRAVTLIDDVITTGATAATCARSLWRSGAAEVRLLTVARA